MLPRRLLIPALLCCAPLSAGAEGETPRDIEEGFAQVEVLTRAMEIIRENYVDADKVTYQRLMTGALRGMLAELDPHSQFLVPEIYVQLREAAEGSYDGAGFTLAPRTDVLKVVTVRPDSPAGRAGLLPGDEVVKIGDHFTEKTGYMEILALLRGNPGETLSLTVQRPATRETLAFSMVREVIRQETVRDAVLLDAGLAGDSKIGYLRLAQFGQQTPRELADALDALEDKGMTALVLDLRNNPGGLLGATVEACGEFLPPNTAVVTTEGRDPARNPPPQRTPARQRRARAYPVAVLVNHSSASGAELMSAALQDLKRAVLVGTTTFGKGSVQSIIPGDNGTAIRLTTAKYFSPSHRPIHEVGITPDIICDLTPEEEKKIFEDQAARGSAAPDPRAMAQLGDRQLERAATALRGLLLLRAAPAQEPGKEGK